MKTIICIGYEESLRKLYLKDRLTIAETAKQLGWNEKKVVNALHKLGIRKHDLGLVNLDDRKLIYIAGLFDGEGSLYILQRGKRLKIVWDIRMTHEDTIKTVFNWLSDGNFHPRLRVTKFKGKDKRGYDRTKHKPCYGVVLNWMQEIKKISELLLPYLITKQHVSQLAVQYVEQRNWGNPYTENDFKIAGLMSKANKRGID